IPWRFRRELLTAFRQVPFRDKQGSSTHRTPPKGFEFTISNKGIFITLKKSQWNNTPPTNGLSYFPTV
ncbi:MAG: hypothetical protein VXX31_10240, partial [Planctomycetota bacterium]|nr:hypothetical protein [Planctomycetota bacterium]